MIDAARVLARAARVLRAEADAVAALVDRLDGAFVRAVALVRECEGRVVVIGIGKSGIVGRKIAATLASTGTPAYFLHPADGVHGDIGALSRGDVVVALSNSGETDEVLAVLPALKRLGLPLIALTGSRASTLAREADVVLDAAVTEEACPLGLAPTSSTTAALALGDALAMAVLECRGLASEDYAALHPSGTLGWKSQFRVRDLMHTGVGLPVVSEHATMKEAIEEMTAKRLGMTTVVDDRGRLLGIITDGDLRRHQLAFGSLLDRRAADCMTPDPARVDGDELAARALDLMEAHAIDGQPRPITSLVVLDEERRPVGVIHLHDILRTRTA